MRRPRPRPPRRPRLTRQMPRPRRQPRPPIPRPRLPLKRQRRHVSGECGDPSGNHSDRGAAGVDDGADKRRCAQAKLTSDTNRQRVDHQRSSRTRSAVSVDQGLALVAGLAATPAQTVANQQAAAAAAAQTKADQAAALAAAGKIIAGTGRGSSRRYCHRSAGGCGCPGRRHAEGERRRGGCCCRPGFGDPGCYDAATQQARRHRTRRRHSRPPPMRPRRKPTPRNSGRGGRRPGRLGAAAALQAAGRPGQGRRRGQGRRVTDGAGNAQAALAQANANKATADAALQQAQDESNSGGSGSCRCSGQRQCGRDSRQPSWPRTRQQRTPPAAKRRQTHKPPTPRLLPQPTRQWFRPQFTARQRSLTKLGGTPTRGAVVNNASILAALLSVGLSSSNAGPISQILAGGGLTGKIGDRRALSLQVLAAGGISGGNASAFASACGWRGRQRQVLAAVAVAVGARAVMSPQAKGRGHDGGDRECHRQRRRGLEQPEIAPRRRSAATIGRGDLTCFAMQHCISTKPR